MRLKHLALTALGRGPRSLVSWSRPDSAHGAATFELAERFTHDSSPAPRLVLGESLRLVAATEDLDFVVAGVGQAQDSVGAVRPIFEFPWGPEVHLPALKTEGGPKGSRPGESRVVGKSLPWLADVSSSLAPTASLATRPKAAPADLQDRGPEVSVPPFERLQSYWVTPGTARRRHHTVKLGDPFESLKNLPEIPGPPTVLFLLPFLAVGGAERLLYDLLTGLGDFRCLVVTLEPHQRHLGETVKHCARWTPWIFTLGDWLPREGHHSALCHLIRRFQVRTLLSWNGTIFFYDRAADLRRRFPELRLIQQLYHFEGGWTSRTSPAVVRALDLHIAVNRPIAQTLKGPLRVPADRVEVIHHGVAIPDSTSGGSEAEGSETEGSEERNRLRAHLGIPDNAVVAGTFIRLHPQKRPLDLLALARRFSDRGLWLIVMGDGPLSQAVADDLERAPIPHLVRVPMQQDPLPYYQALDLCLMTSDYEGLPVFLLDGMARGLPAVAPAVGDIPLLFDQGGGFCSARPGDLDALEQDLARMLIDEVRLEAGRKARRTVAERFGLETYTRAYRRVIFPPRQGSAASALPHRGAAS